MLIHINPDNPQMRLIQKAVDILEAGGVISYPTDTIYGIGCDAFNKKAIERLYRITQKDRKQPLSFICPDLKDVAKYARVSNSAYKIMRKLFPGPYTFILPGTRLVPKMMLTKRRTVGIRVPDNNICLLMAQIFGKPIVSTTVTIADEEPLNDPHDIEDRLGKMLDLVIDGGFSSHDASSVVDLTHEKPVVIRAGKGDVSYFE